MSLRLIHGKTSEYRLFIVHVFAKAVSTVWTRLHNEMSLNIKLTRAYTHLVMLWGYWFCKVSEANCCIAVRFAHLGSTWVHCF